MRIYDIIAKKRDGGELTKQEIQFFIKGYVSGEIKDYQASALLMAIYLRGMSERETVELTVEMAQSGDMLELSSIEGIKADKHSTGGVGDKTTLIVAPIVAAMGIKVAKMSGRGLGHTGGTVDKLESIEGFRTQLSPEEFIETVRRAGLCVVGQSGELAPADKKLYALRDATATVGSIPLIASSIMSKKLAAGSDCIVLDVKYGSGAFMKTAEDALELSEAMVSIGKGAGKRIAAVITDMNTPLGKNIGNSLEVAEAVHILKTGQGGELTEVSLTLAGCIAELCFDVSLERGKELARQVLESGEAYKKLLEMVELQGGNTAMLENTSLLPGAAFKKQVLSQCDGFISSTDAEKIGSAAVLLGAGRVCKEDSIDFGAGIVLMKKAGDRLTRGEVIAELYTNDEKSIPSAEKMLSQALSFSDTEPVREPLIYDIVR